MSLIRRMLGVAGGGRACVDKLESRELFAADLAVTVDSMSTPFDWLVPGDKLTLTVTVTNEGDSAASGQFDLVTQRVMDVDGAGLEELGRRRYTVNLAPGARATFRSIAVTVDSSYAPGTYFYAATAEISDNSATPVPDVDMSNNTGYSAGTVGLVYRFGTFFGDSSRTTRRNLKLTMAVPDAANPAVDELVTMSLSGGGYGELQFNAGSEGNFADAWVRVSETTTSSSMSIAVKGGDKQIELDEDVVIDGPMKSLKAPGVSMYTADVIVGGAMGEVLFADMEHSSVFVEGAGSGLKFTGRDLRNFALDSATPVTSFKAASWLASSEEITDEDVNTVNLLTTTWIGSLAVTGAMSADVSTSGAGAPRAGVLAKATVGGEASGGWSIYGKAGSITVGSAADSFVASVAGALSAFTVNATFAGSVAAFTMGNVTVKGSMVGASLLSGLDLGTDLALGGEGDEQDLVTSSVTDGVIASLTVKGNMTDSFVGAGYYPGASEGDAGSFISGQAAQHKKIVIGGGLAGSVFYGLRYPTTSKVGGQTLVTTENPAVFRTTS